MCRLGSQPVLCGKSQCDAAQTWMSLTGKGTVCHLANTFSGFCKDPYLNLVCNVLYIYSMAAYTLLSLQPMAESSELAAACCCQWDQTVTCPNRPLHLPKTGTHEIVANNHNKWEILAGSWGPAGWCWASYMEGFINVLFILHNARCICKCFVITARNWGSSSSSWDPSAKGSIYCVVLTFVESPNSAEGVMGREEKLTKCILHLVYL